MRPQIIIGYGGNYHSTRASSEIAVCSALRFLKWAARPSRQFSLTFERRELHKGLRPLALRLASWQAAGAHFGCYSAPLHSDPRLSRMALQPTSHWRKRYAQLPPHKTNANFKNRPPRKKEKSPPENKKDRPLNPKQKPVTIQ